MTQQEFIAEVYISIVKHIEEVVYLNNPDTNKTLLDVSGHYEPEYHLNEKYEEFLDNLNQEGNFKENVSTMCKHIEESDPSFKTDPFFVSLISTFKDLDGYIPEISEDKVFIHILNNCIKDIG